MAVRGRGLLEVEPCRRSPERRCAAMEVPIRDGGIGEAGVEDNRARTLPEATDVRAGGRQTRDTNVLIAASQLERGGAKDDARSSKTTRLVLRWMYGAELPRLLSI